MKNVLAFLVLSCAVFAPGQVQNPTAGMTVPVSISSIAPVAGTPTAVLLSKFPISPNLFFMGALSGFSYNLNVNGVAYGCFTGTANSDGSLSLSCVTSLSVPVAPPVTPAPVTTPTLVSQGVWDKVMPANELLSENLGWTVGTGNALFAVVAGGQAGNTATSITAVAGSATYVMKLAYAFTAGRQTVQVYYLPNAPASISSLKLQFNESDTTSFDVSVAEYSGLSATVAPIGASFGYDSGYVSTSSFSAGSYTVPAGALVLSATSSTSSSGTWTAGHGWTSINSVPGLLVQYQIAPAVAGAVMATGTYAGGYQYYDTAIVAFQ